ncbi:hypothetical protein EXS65_04605, partial [Candidatus Peribacteria bacterium]|nr:hypothetical protein [Candidatus Peribacteria bacterium]
LASAFSGTSLKIYGTLSGNILHAEKTLTSSGTLIVLGTTTLRGTTSGNILHAEKTLTSSGTLTVVGAARLKSNLNVVGTISGAALQIMAGSTNYIQGTLGIGTTSPKAKLDVTGTISGNTLVISKNGSFSGTLMVVGNSTVRGTLSGTTINANSLLTGSTIQGFGLYGCQGTANKITYNASTKKFLCEADQTAGGSGNWSNTGSLQTSFDLRYVNQSGDTMTGALLVKANLSGSRLIISGNAAVSGALIVVGNTTIRGTLSGNVIHAEKNLTSSGYITAEGDITTQANFSGSNITITRSASISGTLLVKTSITSKGSLSGATFYGAGLGSCTGSTQKLLYDVATGKFSCGTDLNTGGSSAFGTGNVLTLGDARYVNQSGDTMTGALLVKANLSGSRLIISGNAAVSGALIVVGNTIIRGTLSGKILHAEKTLTSSGTLTFEGAASGSTLYVATSINGAGLTDCDVATQTLNWDSSAGRFSCGTDSDTTYTAGQGLSLNGTTFSLASAFSGTSLKIYGTLSGNVLHAEKTLTSSGTLVVLGTTTLRGTTSGNILHAEKTLTSSGSLTFEGAASGSTLYVATSINGAGLADCDVAATSKLLWDSSTGRFSCGTDQNSGSGAPEVGTTSFTGAVLRLGDARYVNTSGDTMTGALLVKANLSGSRLIISGNAAVSGALIVVSDTTIRGTLSGNILHAEKTLTSSGTLVVLGNSKFRATLSGNILHAEKTLTSSGTLTVVGAARLKSNLNVVGTISGAALQIMAGSTNYIQGTLGIGTTSPKAKLDVTGTISGNTLVISKNGSFSGTLMVVGNSTVRGTLSGTTINANSLLTGATIQGFGLYGCQGTANKITYNASTKKFLCEADQGSGAPEVGTSSFSGATLRLGDARYVNTSGDTMTGALTINLTSGSLGLKILNTASGNIIHAEKSLTSSGLLMVTQRLSQGSGAFVLNQLANSTGAYLRMSHTGSIHPLLVLDSVRQTWLSPAIMFGYRGSFDVSMQRTSTGVLALSGSLTIDQYLAVQKFAGATADAICYTSTGMLALCSSSLRYKEDVQDLSIGLTTLREMRPVNFKWKGRDQRDIGFIAEEVAAIDPMLATYNNAGEIQGVKYMQLTAVLTKAVQALDARLLGITNDAGTVLHARDLMTSSGALRVATIGTFGSGILLDTKYTDGSKTVFEVKSNVSSGSQTVFRINASGSVFTAGTFNSQGADYAEWFKSANKLRAGEVVCIDTLADNTVKRCENTADSNVMGIVSTRPAFIGNTIPGTEGLSNTSINRLGYYLIGLIGQVPARATLEGGDIRSGDALTSASDAGFIRKARAGESTVGVALEAFDGSSPFDAAQGNRVRTINVLISRRNSSMTVDAVSQKVLDTIASMEIGDEVKRMITASTQQLNLSGSIASAVSEQLGAFSIESRIGAAIDRRFLGSMLTFGSGKTLHAAALDIESGATIRGNLRIEGTLILSAARAVLGPISISGSSVAIGSLMATGSLKVIGPITVEGLATFLGNVEIKGELSVSTKQAGIAAIAKNGTGVSVTFSGAFVHTPIVTATSDNFGAWRLRRRSLTGFTIELKDPADLDTTFTWLALSSVAPQRTSATGASVALIPFFVNAAGYPVSSDPVWNGCISGRLLADSDGVPFSCSRYHSDSMWDHPDLKISFIFNASHDPAILTIPEGYEVLTQSQEPVTVPEVETTSLSESASSESSSSESAPSEPAKTPVESDPPVIPETETGSIVNE